MPSTSAAIWAKAVRWPCPSSVEPTSTIASPSASSRTTALETGWAPAARSPTDRPRPVSAGLSSCQPSASATFSISPMRSASSGLPPGRTCSPGRSRLRRRISSASRPVRRADLVDLHLAHPLHVGGAERSVGTRWRGVGVDAQGIHPHRGPAIGTRCGVTARGRDAGAVVGVGAGVEGDDHIPREQRARAVRRRAHVDAGRRAGGW